MQQSPHRTDPRYGGERWLSSDANGSSPSIEEVRTLACAPCQSTVVQNTQIRLAMGAELIYSKKPYFSPV